MINFLMYLYNCSTYWIKQIHLTDAFPDFYPAHHILPTVSKLLLSLILLATSCPLRLHSFNMACSCFLSLTFSIPLHPYCNTISFNRHLLLSSRFKAISHYDYRMGGDFFIPNSPPKTVLNFSAGLPCSRLLFSESLLKPPDLNHLWCGAWREMIALQYHKKWPDLGGSSHWKESWCWFPMITTEWWN